MKFPFCELDSHAGDNDFRMSVAKGFRALEREWEEVIAESDDIASFLNACSLIIMENCGGASGPIWGSAFRAASKAAEGKKTLNNADMAEVLAKAVTGNPGDRRAFPLDEGRSRRQDPDRCPGSLCRYLETAGGGGNPILPDLYAGSKSAGRRGGKHKENCSQNGAGRYSG